MEQKKYQVESSKPFSESMIWEINRGYYQKAGLNAWRDNDVPHHLTSNVMVGRAYAELIFGFLKDLASKGVTREKIYILELGAGHGRLSFHVIKHLQRLIGMVDTVLPDFCYVLSDIVESNLDFFHAHPQFQEWFSKGLLDMAYFDGLESKELLLRHSKTILLPQQLDQPLIAIANYFFDSLPNALFQVKDGEIYNCSIALESALDPEGMDEATLLKNLELVYDKAPLNIPFYEDPVIDEILGDYKELVQESYILFPEKGLQCIKNLQGLSSKGLMLLTMDKGYAEVHDLEGSDKPEIITHGSFSVWVNYHALGAFCKKQGGNAMFPAFASLYLQLGCLQFLPDGETYRETGAAYQRFVNDFGPDDLNGLKRFTYQNFRQMNLMELIAILRLFGYDSTIFKNLLPWLKKICKQVTFNERTRLAQTMHQTWEMYFTIYESFDLAYEIGGIFYDLGFYGDALLYFGHSAKLFGPKADIFYNQALCHYQLRDDVHFVETLQQGRDQFPGYEKFEKLELLDLEAI
ncbi:MAG: SAM-dependent methyltransferase [Saprospiraceae bacterium]|nr:SAM-dependent methyltransferase [Saprospiraceae bacterium]MCB9325695.1 SAM-dependent methyltransferase [Lewinellaceae bacterium]